MVPDVYSIFALTSGTYAISAFPGQPTSKIK